MKTAVEDSDLDGQVAPTSVRPTLARMAWSIAEVAAALKLSKDLVRAMCRRGDIRFIKPGKEYRIPDTELQRLLGNVVTDAEKRDVA